MPRYWVIAPVESKPPKLFDKVWKFDLENSLISIGWKQLGDVSKMSREELSEAIAVAYPDKPPPTQGLHRNMIWSFYHEIEPGDIIIARRGRKILAALGEVTQSSFYAPGTSPKHEHPNFLKVTWREELREKVFPTVVFPMPTLAEFSEEQYNNLLEGSVIEPLPKPDAETEDPNAFVLEKYLEEFIVSNFKTIFKGKLKIFEENDINEGQQYATDVGPIDILAIETKTDAFVVVSDHRQSRWHEEGP